MDLQQLQNETRRNGYFKDLSSLLLISIFILVMKIKITAEKEKFEESWNYIESGVMCNNNIGYLNSGFLK